MKTIITLFILFFSVSLFAEIKILKMNGSVFINNEPYQATMKLKETDIIEARGKKSFAQVKIYGHSVILLRNGKMKLSKVSEKKKNRVELVSGKIFHYLKPKREASFEIKTRQATMGVRGTKYMLEQAKDSIYLCVCEGMVSVYDYLTKKLQFTNKDQDIHVYSRKTEKVRDASADMMNMTKDEFKFMGFPVK